MAARLKRVVEAPMVAHLWAHQSQEDARNQRRNIFFDGDTIYSYGLHFPIARHVTNRRGERAVLLTTRRCSVTTAGHISCVAGACRHLRVFRVLDPRSEGAATRREDFVRYREQMLELMRKFSRARQHKPYILGELNRLVEEANAFAAFFGIRQRLRLPNPEEMAAECAAIAKRESEREKREKRKRVLKQQKALDEWLNGGPRSWLGYGDLPVRLRLVGEVVETSRGASVDLADAKRAYRILKKLRKRGETFKRNGERIAIGHFDVDSVDETGTVKIGCHEIEWTEIERLAALAGV